MHTPEPFEDLKPVQYQDAFHEDNGPLINVSKSALRWTSYFLTAVVLLFIFLGSNVKLARYITYPFVLKDNEQEQVYRFFDEVYLDEKYGSVGQEVSPGDPLLRIRSSQIVNLINSYEAAKEKQSLFEKLGASLYTDRITASLLEKEKAIKKRGGAQQQAEKVQRMYENELEKQKFLVEVAKRNYQMEQELFAGGLISRMEFDKVRDELMLSEHQMKTIKESYDRELLSLKNQMEVSDIDKAMSLNDYSSKGREMENQRESLKRDTELAHQKIMRNYGNVSIEGGSLIFKASTKGRISYIVNTEKDIPTGTVIMKIKGDHDTLYASATIPPENIGFIKEGSPVILKVATFPHYEWGVLDGRIKTLSLTPDEKGNYPFEVEITNAGNLKDKLQIGMNGEVSVTVEEKSFFGYMFEKVRQGYRGLSE